MAAGEQWAYLHHLSPQKSCFKVSGHQPRRAINGKNDLVKFGDKPTLDEENRFFLRVFEAKPGVETWRQASSGPNYTIFPPRGVWRESSAPTSNLRYPI